MKSLKDVLALVIGIAAALFAIYEFVVFITYKNPQGVPDPHAAINHLWMAIGGAVVAFICGLLYFVGHVNKEDEIHITQ
jgi:hypothetical protein